MAFTKIASSVPFVTSVQLECGFVTQINATTLPKTLFLDTHCIHCYKTIINSNTDIMNTIPICTGNINAYVVVGALHYNMRFGNFTREQKLTTAAPNSVSNLSSIQSICVNNVIAYDCNNDCTETDDTICTSYSFTPQFQMFKLYSDTELTGVDLYSDIASSTLTPEAIAALNYPTGCKTIVVSGYININVKN